MAWSIMVPVLVGGFTGLFISSRAVDTGIFVHGIIFLLTAIVFGFVVIAKGEKVIRTSMTMNGCGAASLRISPPPSPTVFVMRQTKIPVFPTCLPT
ncbi:MAG: hypothetical protein O3A84_05765 [Proteobacteria bacterium]|nr:hypothetical protein [Pseudomonadota bacterium]